MDEKLQALVEHGIEFANKILIEDRQKELTPMFHLVSRSGAEDAIVATPWGNDLEKKIAVAGVKSIAHKMDAIAVCFMTEAWMVRYDKPLTDWHRKRQTHIPPSQHPQRIELVMVIATNPANEFCTAMLQIVRDKPGGRIISLVKDSELPSDNYESWIFDGMFRP